MVVATAVWCRVCGADRPGGSPELCLVVFFVDSCLNLLFFAESFFTLLFFVESFFTLLPFTWLDQKPGFATEKKDASPKGQQSE